MFSICKLQYTIAISMQITPLQPANHEAALAYLRSSPYRNALAVSFLVTRRG
jgi:hypothetical protein